MIVVPVKLRDAISFVEEHHRHNRGPQGGILAIGAALDDVLWAVAIMGRPVARGFDDGSTAEVIRLCARAGAPKGACSFLYARVWRVAVALGYRRLITYTLQSESGASLRGAG